MVVDRLENGTTFEERRACLMRIVDETLVCDSISSSKEEDGLQMIFVTFCFSFFFGLI